MPKNLLLKETQMKFAVRWGTQTYGKGMLIYLFRNWLIVYRFTLPSICWKSIDFMKTNIQIYSNTVVSWTSGLQCFSFSHDVIAFEVSDYLSSQRKESPIKKVRKLVYLTQILHKCMTLEEALKVFPVYSISNFLSII